MSSPRTLPQARGSGAIRIHCTGPSSRVVSSSVLRRASAAPSCCLQRPVTTLCIKQPVKLRAGQKALRRTSPTCSAVAPNAISAAASSNLPGLLLGAGLFLLGVAACIFVIAAIPAILQTRQTMLEMQSVLRTVERELPDTAAAVRLSGLELSDAIEEVSLLSNDLTMGVRATAQMMTATRTTITDSVLLANAVMASHVLPAVRSRLPGARGKVEDRLRESAKLQYRAATVQQAASAAKVAAGRTRAALATLDLAGAMRRTVQMAQQLRSAQGRPPVPLAPQ
ncbi:g2222 [Coccomyxa viridis]|uniref:G2222 protein n=1 Tax=Coccomyxa viridis TaxID=1274662 RepID=A0ABP1FQ24_9CHLO